MAYADVILDLSKVIESFDPYKVISIYNYDNRLIGSYHIGDYIEALDKINNKYSVIHIDNSDDENIIVVIQELNEVKLSDLIYEVKVTAQMHDKYFGDGKYWKNTD